MKITDQNIAFFDSGIGGMTVLKEAYQLLPNENYIYYADTEHVPYGTKSKEIVRDYIFSAVDFLSRMNIKMLVIACNTATSIAANELRKTYPFPIVGMEPAVKPAIEKSREKRILVLATTLTLKEEKLDHLIRKLDHKKLVDKLALDPLVAFAQKFEFNNAAVKDYLKEIFSGCKFNDYSEVVLGCTHFIYFRDIIKEFFPSAEMIDGNRGTVNNMKNILEKAGLLHTGSGGIISYFSSESRITDSQMLFSLNQLIAGK